MSTSTQTQNQSSSNVADINGQHPAAGDSHTLPDATKTLPPNEQSTNQENVEKDPVDSTYPEQKHAGAVGYGPNFNQQAGLADKIGGLKDEIKGRITNNPELVAKGHDRRTGELKHKEQEEDDAQDPFANADEKKGEQPPATNGTPGSTTTNGAPTTNGSGTPSTTSVPTTGTQSGAAGTNNATGTTTGTSGIDNGTAGTTSTGT
ncbi:hypothetical protein DFH07DRAFT_922590 [Mycena maculata]|uniref:Uncharacterized protein n=1 Tax=Mycena maculata TaxID=230809 RepID=A0AAD7IV38_9AGAR|nr:hypothetical protein DFH07DRAFT_922590 [Mycena maculata]